MPDIPAAEMGASGMPGRGLEYVKPVVHEGEPAIEAFCDCGTTTVVVVEGGLTRPLEFSFVCDPEHGGCGSVHWLTISPTQEASDG